MTSHDLGEALTRAAARIGTRSSLEETLQAVVSVALDTMPEIDHVGVTLRHKLGHLETSAATDDVARRLDSLQYDLGEGPCVTALTDGERPFVVVEHARHSGEWNRFIPQAVAEGLRSQLGIRLRSGDTTIGVLNLYSTSSDTISLDTRHLAELFATHVAIAYSQVDKRDNLEQALASRETVGRAVGIVMERYQLTSDRAFEYLVRVSATSETKLRDVARQVVETTEQAYARRQEGRSADAPSGHRPTDQQS